MSPVVVLGPQRLRPTLRETVASLGSASRLAVVTAGWQEREDEDGELLEHLEGRGVNLRLFARTEEAFAKDAELLDAFLAYNDRLKELQRLYRIRLGHALDAARALMRTDAERSDAEILEIEREQALDDVRRVDAQHLERLTRLNREFEEAWRPTERKELARQRAEVEGELASCDTVCIAGGHVLVLVNRLRLFGLVPLIGERRVIAWSAGAMALAERIVVFHDSPPQGAGNAEVLQQGVALYRGIVPLPHARRRLRLDDPVRVGIFARRFRADVCAALDDETRVDWDGSAWTLAAGTKRLFVDGSVKEEA